MRRFIFLLLVCLTAVSKPAQSEGFKLKPSERVLILGDSITHGGTYVTMFEAYLYRNHPDLKVDVLGVGLSSETASGLSEKTHPFPRPDVHTRLDSALAKTKPNVVVACYGMNDGIYHPQS
ncbi:MAG: hypothetical protein R3236_09200, partial [Phycisphaeraceae bacterium]|nr:hypothetical protein [Phycisphaeraceae bacterium]